MSIFSFPTYLQHIGLLFPLFLSPHICCTAPPFSCLTEKGRDDEVVAMERPAGADLSL